MILRIITIIIVISITNNLCVKSKHIASNAMSERSDQDEGTFEKLSDNLNDGK